MAGYLAVRNQPVILGAQLGYTSIAAVLAGYLTAKIAGPEEMLHGGVAALLQTTALVCGFTAGEYAASSRPVWMRMALVLVTGPAMLLGAVASAPRCAVEGVRS